MHTTVAEYKRKSIICTLILTTVAHFVTKDPSFQHENIGAKASRPGPQSDWAIKRINTEKTFGEFLCCKRLIGEVVQSQKAPTSAFTFRTLLKHYAKRLLTPQ